MQNSIFTVELPLISTNDELDTVMKLYPEYDPYFIASGCIKDRKEKFDKLWKNFRPYADRHFLSQLKTNFHQRTWEMYVGNVLIEKKLSIASENEGPDFVVNNNFYVECIASTKGEAGKPDSVPPMETSGDVPVDKIILRITQALKDKAIDQYTKWKNKNWFNPNSPFVIAINTGDLEYPQDYLGIPLVIKALFGLHFLQINQHGDSNYSWRTEIKKGDGVPVTYFANENLNFVSGIIYSDRTVLDHPKTIGDDCIFINNPFAKNEVPESFFKHFKNWKAKNGTLLKDYS